MRAGRRSGYLPACRGRAAGDVEVVVAGMPTPTGFEAATPGGNLVSVVYATALERVHGPFAVGERLRILGGQVGEDGTVELKPWTEVFHRGPD